MNIKFKIEPYRSQMTIWLMRTACWIIKATNTQSEYVLIIVFFYCNNGYTRVPQFYVLHTLPVFFPLSQTQHREITVSSLRKPVIKLTYKLLVSEV
jgi:hypothetical protein